MIKKLNGFRISYEVNRYLKQVLEDKEYRFLHYYPVVVDVGANIGTFSLYIYENADKIYSLEPVEENINHLKKTIELNNLEKIVPLQIAISDKSYVHNMEELGEPGMGGWKISESGTYPVDTRSITDFMKSQEIEYIDLLKLDVEGEELKILSSQLFPYKQIGTIIGEYHSDMINKKIQEILEWMGYKYIDISGHFIARR